MENRIDLQIWYAGTRDIEVGHAAMMSAAIYAPNASRPH
jgi:hypothetical protein